MCRSDAEDGRRCTDHRHGKATPLADLCPDPAPTRPDVDWANDPASAPAQLYETYPAPVATTVVDLMVTAKKQEAEMTDDVLAALPAGAQMHGLDFRMKSPASLARKINDRWEIADVEPEEIAERITDVVRYTAIAKADQLVDTATSMAGELAARGWTVTEVEQSYLPGNQYKGLHMLARHSSGRTAEFQFHTAQSQQVKDRTHLDYEKARAAGAQPADRVEAMERMTAEWESVPTPKGLDSLVELGGCRVKPKRYAPAKTKE